MNDDKLLDFFQSGFYENFWAWEFNENESIEIAEKSIKLLGINTGHILDWCGGWGRISFHLAKKGFKITILDFVEDYLAKAKKTFKDANLDLTTINSDCRETPSNIQADNAICTFNSVGFLTDSEQVKAFKSLYNAIKNGGKIIIDCMNQLFIAKNFLEIIQNTKPGGAKYLQKNKFDLKNSILFSKFQMIDKDENLIEEKSFNQRIYTPLELAKMLEISGFKILEMYGNFEGDDLSFDLPQIITIAQK